MTYDEWERQGLVVDTGDQDAKMLSFLAEQDWSDRDEASLLADIKASGKDNVYNAVRSGLMLYELEQKGIVLDEAYFAEHDAGITYANARRKIILATSPRTWMNWEKPVSWRATHELVKYNPRHKYDENEDDAPQEFYYAVKPNDFEYMIRTFVCRTTTQRQIKDYVHRHRLKPKKRLLQPTTEPPEIFVNRITCGDCLDLIKLLPDDSIDAVITSPPYADQQNVDYEGISDIRYPTWFCKVMKELWPKLREHGNVIVVLGSQIKNGEESLYIDRTRLAVCQDGWKLPQKLYWYKRSAPPVGSTERCRKLIDEILWFSKSINPYFDLRACGKPSDRIGSVGSSNHHYNESNGYESGIARIADVFSVNLAGVDKGVEHTALMPSELARQLVLTFSRPDAMVLDPFAGSGTTLLVARKLGRSFIGMEKEQKYVDLTNHRLGHDRRYK